MDEIAVRLKTKAPENWHRKSRQRHFSSVSVGNEAAEHTTGTRKFTGRVLNILKLQSGSGFFNNNHNLLQSV